MEQGSLRAIYIGVVTAVVFAVVGGLGAAVYLRSTGALDKISTLDDVVVVLQSRGQDGVDLGGVVAVATNDGAEVSIVDPLKKVSISGTSYNQLRDAYPFGGARAIAGALRPGAGARAAWIDVPQSTWVAALKAAGDTAPDSGVTGVRVTLPRSIEVFDGQRLASFPEGTSVVSAGDVPLLLRGVAYLPAASRMQVIDQVGRAALDAFGEGTARQRLSTNLTRDALARLLSRLRSLR